MAPEPASRGVAAVERAGRAAATLQRGVALLQRLARPRDFLSEVMPLVAEAFGATSCGYWEHFGSAFTLRYCACEGRVFGPSDLNLVEQEHPGAVEEWAQELALSNFRPRRDRSAPVISEPGGEDELPGIAIRFGWRHQLTIPVVVDERAVATLILARSTDEPFEAEEVASASSLGRQLALVVDAVAHSHGSEPAPPPSASVRAAEHRAQDAERRVGELVKANEALNRSLVTIAAAPVAMAPALMLIEVERAASAVLAYWFEYDRDAHTLEVVLRVAEGRVIDTPVEDEPALFRGPFAADVTPAFGSLCAGDSFITLTTHGDSELIWEGANAWHRRNGRTEALAFVVRVGTQPLGVVGLAFTDRTTLDDVQEQLVRALANQFALALQLSRLAGLAASKAVEQSRAEELEIANDATRRAVEQLAVEPDLPGYLGYLLHEVASQLGSDTALITPYDEAADAFHIVADLQDGEAVRFTPMPASTQSANMGFLQRLEAHDGITLLDTERDEDLFWPGAANYFRSRGRRYALTLAIRAGGRVCGQISLAYAEPPDLKAHQIARARALATNATLAIQLTRLGAETRAAETARAVAAERNRMAGEIHDSLAQSFTSIALQSESAISQLEATSPLRVTLALIEDTARLGLAEARSSVLALRPVGDGVGELEKALEQLAERCNIAGSVTCEFRTHTKPRVLSGDVRDAVLRIAQEAVNNALRHASARRLVIEFDVYGDEARLAVVDDGGGMPTAARDRPAGFGIAGMQARVESLGGTFTQSPGAGGVGTAVRVRVPCNARHARS